MLSKMVPVSAFFILIFLFFFGPSISQAFAVTNTYTGSSGGAWETGSNWDQGHAPTSGEDVVIDANKTVNINAGTTITSLTVGPTATSTLNFAYDASADPLIISGNLTVNSNGNITHSAGTASIVGKIYITVGGSATITGSINVNGKGYGASAVDTAAGNGPGGGNGGGCCGGAGSGGGYGGTGQVGTGLGPPAGGITYGSLTVPTDLGSSGGNGNGDCYTAGSGGGAIRIAITGSLTVSGSITANGSSGCTRGGAGSGGSIYLTMDTLSGAGTIQATGGSGPGGGGGGGRISIYYATNSWTGNSLTAAGAATLGTGTSGGTDGTVNFVSNSGLPTPPSQVTSWKFDEGQGTTAHDSTPQNWGLTLFNSPAWKPDDQCVSGTCLYFDGSNDYASNITSTNLSNTKQVTVEFWLKWMSFGHDDKQAMELTSDYSSNNDGFYIDPNGASGFEFGLKGNIGTTRSYFTQPSAQVWHHYVFIMDKTTGANSLAAYVDGVSQSLTAITSSANTNYFGNENLYFMSRAGSSNFGNGFLDEVKIYNYDRSATQILADLAARGINSGASSNFGRIFQNNIPSALANGLAGYWDLDTTSTLSTFADSTSNNVLTNVSVPTVAGNFGNAVSFTGANGIYAYKNSTASLPTGSAARTFSMWFKLNSSNPGQMEFGGWGANSTAQRFAFYTDTTCGHQLGIETAGGAQTFTWSPDTNWHQITAVFPTGQTNLNQTLIYYDGVAKTADCSSTSQTLNTTNTDIVIGGLAGFPNGCCNYAGLIDDVQVYNTDLSAGSVATLYSSAPATQGGLVGHWTFNESTPYYSDNSGNGTTIASANAGQTAGKYGTGASFNGTSQYLDAGDGTSLQITGALTLAAWVKLTDHSSVHDILAKKGSSGNYGYRLYVDTGGKLNLEVSSNGTSTTTVTGLTTLSNSTWYHLTGVYIPGISLAVYVNGALEATNTTSIPSSIYNSTTDLNVGGENTGASNLMTGTMDEPRVYNSSLRGEDVTALYNFAKGPVGYWKFDEPTGTTAYDSSGNGYNGTLSGSTSHVAIGKFGQAINTDNSTSDYIDVSSVPIGSTWTLEAWFKYPLASNGSSWWTLFRGTTSDHPIIVQRSDSQLGLFDGTGATGFNGSGYIMTALSTGWHHIAATTDSSTQKFYIDGHYVGQASHPSSASIKAIGNYQGGSQNWGTIDDARIYNYQRNSTQVIQDLNAGHPAPGSPVGSAVGWWKFDEGVDNTCSGGTNDVCNSGSAGSALDGTNTSSTWTQSGKFGKALTFGSGSFIQVSDNNALDLSSTGTVSAWVYRTGDCNPNTFSCAIIDKGNSDNNQAHPYRLALGTNNQVVMLLGNNSTSEQTTASTATAIPANQWTYVSGVWTGSQIQVYINGVLQATATQTITPYNSSDAVYIGKVNYNPSTDESFTGTIDEVKIYRGALSADQIKVDMNQGKSQVLGALGNNSSYQPNAANQEYCVPGDATSCAAPVGRWDFEEGTGSTVNDTSGNANTGTWSGTLGSQWANGTAKHTGKVGLFNGSDNYVQKTSPSNLPTSSTARTVEAWVNFNAVNTKQAIIQFGNTGSTRQTFLLDLSASGVLEIGTWADDLTSTTSISPNTWYHVVGTYDGATTLKLYINGVLDKTYALSGTLNTTLDGTGLNIGAWQSPHTNFLNGKIDQVRVFNYARTAAQAAWDYNQGKPIGWWKMDECTGTSAHDSSGNSNTGTISIGGSGTQTAAGTCTDGDAAHAWNNGAIGKFNGSLNFDGTDDLVTTSNNIGLSGDAAFSISAWVKLSSTAVEGAAVSFGDPNSSLAGATLDFNATVTGGVSLEFAGNNGARTAAGIVTTGQWYHVVAVKSPGAINSTTAIYINGKLQTLASASSNTPNITNQVVYIGRYRNPATSNFPGQIDDVRVYSYPLTLSQVQTVMNQGAVRFGPVTGAP